MSVVVSDQEIAPSVRELKIEVPAAAVEAETLRVVQEYRRKARLPGFRKGKAPAAVVRGRFRQDIDQEVLERLVPRYWHQAEAEKSIQPLLAPRIQEAEVKDGEPLVFKAVVEVRPKIDVSDNRSFELPELEVAVSSGEVDEVLAQLQRQSAPWVPVEREAARGDRVELRLREKDANPEAEGADEAEATPPTEGGDEVTPEWQEAAFEVGDGRVWEELSLAVSGLKAGQTGSFTRKEEHHHHGDAEGEAGAHDAVHEVVRSFDFEVAKVLEQQISELTDDSVKTFGDFETVEDLRKNIEQGIASDKERRRYREREQAMLGQLVERHPLEVPERVVQGELQEILKEYAENLARSGVDPNKAEVDWQELAERFMPMAERRVKARLVLDAVADADDVQVREAELEAVIQRMAQAEGRSALQLRRWLDEQGRLGALRQDLRRQRTIRLLLGEGDAIDPQAGESGGELEAEPDSEAGEEA